MLGERVNSLVSEEVNERVTSLDVSNTIDSVSPAPDSVTELVPPVSVKVRI